jgi:hypothetical protein
MSFIGYGNIFPNSNVDPNFVNVGSTNNPSNFGSNEIPGLPGLSGAKWNVDAAASRVPGICMTGGARKIKRKIKNITYNYKMKGGKRTLKRKIRMMKSKIRSKYSKRRHGKTCRCKLCNKSKRCTRRMMRGGYSQFMNNLPSTPSMSMPVALKPSESALASPTPFAVQNTCQDNYNHYDNSSFPSRGH